MAQTVKHPLSMWATRVQSLGWEGALEEGMASHPPGRILFFPGESPWTEEPGGTQST